MIFCKLLVLILAQNIVKGLKVTKIVKQIKLETVYGELEVKKLTLETIIQIYFRQTLVFM